MIAFFSRADENYFSGAMRYVKVGNTEVVVNLMKEMVEADTFKIEMANPYSPVYMTCIEEAKTMKTMKTNHVYSKGIGYAAWCEVEKPHPDPNDPDAAEQMEDIECLLHGDFYCSYRDEDYEAVCDFLIELNQKDKTHINWNWARFEWMMEHPEFDKNARSSIGLWWSESKVVGAAIYDMYFGEAFCAALPEYEALFPEILDYAYRELKDDSGLAIAINKENEAEIRAVLQAGFEQTDQKETIMELSFDRTFSSTLPEGLQLREMDQIVDREALEWLFWQGFDHGEDREAFERSSEHVPHVRKHFNRTLSLSAAVSSGEPVSHCSLWFHPDTDYAYVEPVCTIPGCRGKGIASALLSEAFSRARNLGAKEAFVISDLPFYEKLGFEKMQHYVFYRKK